MAPLLDGIRIRRTLTLEGMVRIEKCQMVAVGVAEVRFHLICSLAVAGRAYEDLRKAKQVRLNRLRGEIHSLSQSGLAATARIVELRGNVARLTAEIQSLDRLIQKRKNYTAIVLTSSSLLVLLVSVRPRFWKVLPVG